MYHIPRNCIFLQSDNLSLLVRGSESCALMRGLGLVDFFFFFFLGVGGFKPIILQFVLICLSLVLPASVTLPLHYLNNYVGIFATTFRLLWGF